MHPPTGGRAAPSVSAAPTQTPSAQSWGRGLTHRESACVFSSISISCEKRRLSVTQCDCVDVHTVNRSASQFLTKADSLKCLCLCSRVYQNGT